MGERMFWIDESDETSEELESDHDVSNSNFPHLHPQDAEMAGAETTPLGLTLTKTPSFLTLLQNSLSKGKQPKPDSSSSSKSEKLKASNFPAMLIQIGSWQRVSRHQGELVVKLYYAKRKLVWEVLDRALKSKIEMQWSDISAIRALTPANAPGTLEVQLNRPPLFYRESNPQPRKHTLWHQTSDFTGGQAPIYRRHYVRFPPGILDRHYQKLLQCDERLSALSCKPFPSNESPYFDWNAGPILEMGLNAGGSSGHFQQPQYPYVQPVQGQSMHHQNPWSSQGMHYQNSSRHQPKFPAYSTQESGAMNPPDYYHYDTWNAQSRSNANTSGGTSAVDVGQYSNWYATQQTSDTGSMNMQDNSSNLPFPNNFRYFNP